MKYRLMNFIVAGFTILSLVFMSCLLTQDEGSAFADEVNRLVAEGVSKEEIKDYLRQNGYANDIVGGTQALKEAQASGYFNNKKSEAPAASTAPAPTATPKPKHEHKYSAKLTKDPTCNEDGALTYTCDCGDTYEEPVTKLEHNYVESVTKEPTCTTDGEKTFKCSLCGDSYTEVIAANGHTDGQFTVTKEPTCTEPGEKTIYCSVCNEPIRTETIEATGHENTYVNTVNPGFFTPGREEVTCMKCYEVLETKEIPVPMWQYILTGGIVLVILLVVIVVNVKNRKK